MNYKEFEILFSLNENVRLIESYLEQEDYDEVKGLCGSIRNDIKILEELATEELKI